MNFNFAHKVFLSALALLLSSSCFKRNEGVVLSMGNNQLIAEVKKASAAITKYAGEAELNSLLQCYSDSIAFLAISSDGKCRNFGDFKEICTEYYQSLRGQKVTTTNETFYVIDSSHVLLTWSGSITAYFKNGDTMEMNDYTVTSIFEKTDNNWKVIHSQESSMPPEIRKAKSIK